MSFPFIFEANFDTGASSGDSFDSLTDVEGVVTYRSYPVLSTYSVTDIGPIAPYRGAYVVEWDLSGDANDHTFIEGDIDIADTVTRYSRFYVFFGKDFRATVTDIFNLYEVQGTANAVEGVVGFRITAGTNVIEIGTGQVAPTTFASNPIPKGQWVCVELVSNIRTAGTGTSDVWVDGSLAASVTTLTNTAVLRGVLGVQNQLATTLGHLFVDAFVFDDTQIGRILDRYAETVLVTKSIHVCLGASEILNVTLLPGTGTNSVLKIWDTDIAMLEDENTVVAHLFNLTASEPPIDLADVPLCVKRGAYVQLSGTAPRALVHIGKSQGHYSVGRVRQHGSKVTPFGTGL
jgi:hypothetical protein